jgi:hypothetical protein
MGAAAVLEERDLLGERPAHRLGLVEVRHHLAQGAGGLGLRNSPVSPGGLRESQKTRARAMAASSASRMSGR